ncbi:c-type cytochrome [Methylophaga sp.]|uniref:c-type cytochrome n=1 Tax=Methylophaga sp. TaxID=2024840 RepID=UPI003F69CE62
MSTLPKLTHILPFLVISTVISAEPQYQKHGENAESVISKPEWNLTITPDGENLPPGSGNAAQGKKIFNQQCASCHGFEAIGASAMPLVGEVGSLKSEYPEKTVNSFWPYATTLFDYIRRSMPPSAPYSLNSNEIYALCAYILSQDGIIKSGVELNEATLPQVTMPNRDGFSVIYQQ